MANPEHLAILNQGVKVWNRWRKENPHARPDLTRANLLGTNLEGADFRAANLLEANLRGANLRQADLRGADLTGAELNFADLTATMLDRARLKLANLSGANFNLASLVATDLTGATLHLTVLADIDLSTVEGLEKVRHVGPSTLGLNTLVESRGRIPEAFLRGSGLPDEFIRYAASLVGKPLGFYSCFISYSSKDEEFAQGLHADFQAKGVRCWFAPEDLKIGDKFRVTIDETIRVYDKLLLVLSEHSVQSDWVEKEIETALEREHERKCTMLFPIRLDGAVMDLKTGWPADIRRTRHIGDFTKWKDHDAYQKAFTRLLRDLKASELRKP